MINRLLLTLSFFIAVLSASAQLGAGAIKATITDGSNGEPIPFANVVVKQNGALITGAQSDFDGIVEIKPIQPGTYSIEITSVGYGPIKLDNVRVTSESTTRLTKDQTKLFIASKTLTEFEVRAFTTELFNKGSAVVKQDFSKEDIVKMVARSPADLAAQSGGTFAKDDGSGSINFRGARDDANYYYIDGVKIRGGTSIPRGSIDQLSVMMGGIPARYGDVTGGVISITTKGVSNQYHGGIELLSSGVPFNKNSYVGLDPYGYNLLEGSLSGPFLSKTDSLGLKTALMGFSLSGNFVSNKDPRPSAVGAWKVNDDVLEQLKEDPLRQGFTANSVILNTDYLRLNDFEHVKVRPNTNNHGANMNGKITFAPNSNTDIAVGGSLNYSNGKNYDYNQSLFDYEHYATQASLDWRAYARFTQRFENAQLKPGDSKPAISNAYYNIQIDYSQTNFKRQNSNFGDNFFNYGYLGKFKTYQAPDFAFGADSLTGIFGLIQQTYKDTLITFTPADANPDMAKFTERYYELNGWEGFDDEGNPVYDPNKVEAFTNYNNIQSGGGLINGDNLDGRARNIYGMWIYNGDVRSAVDNYATQVTNQIRLSGQGSADIKDHQIVVGFEYEQRIDRSYSLAPRYLWTIARLRANTHIDQLDFNNPTITYPGPYITYSRLNSSPGDYDNTNDDETQAFIDYNLRKQIGLNPDGVDFLDVNSIDPSEFKIEYYSADELYNNGSSVVGYFGYDVYGNKPTETITFDDFFTKKDQYGNYTMPIAAFQPIYVAGYIEDKFEYDDLIFNVGMRVDRYDANQKVLIDDYVLFPTLKASSDEAQGLLPEGTSRPSNIGDDYVVYVDNIQNPTEILGYRSGRTWYSPDGIELGDASSLRISSGLPAPLLEDKNQLNSVDIRSNSFKDYKPQTNFMPRIAFNFALSDDAKFFAHYDVLTKRPTTGARLDPSDYYFLEARASSAQLNNPSLQPEKTIDYEVGFSQKISNSAAITLSSFYRELRNLVSSTRVFDAFPIEYVTFANLDFATVKGFQFKYDQRQTQNLTFRIEYTLQFAEGTGSNSTSQLNLARSGQPNLRAPIRLGFDQRHQIVGNIDYRYGSGSDYNGPVVGEKKVFESMGANIQLRGGSGLPYNPQSNFNSSQLFTVTPASLQKGAINSASLPWKFRFDLNLDKNFKYTLNADKKKALDCTIYMQVLNLLNARNINNVYRATGNPDDDGYLNSAYGLQFTGEQNSPYAFREYYTMKLYNPTNWELPRRIRLGLRVNF